MSVPIRFWESNLGIPYADALDGRNKESNILVLNYTLACPLKCDFCCYGCHPNRTEKMPLNLAINLINQVAKMRSFSSVGFTGGEPLLFVDEILILAKVLKSHNIPFTIATAAHWAKDMQSARTILEPLKEQGLTRINISHDASHEIFVPEERIINAALSADALGIKTYIVATFFGSRDQDLNIEKALSDTRNIEIHKKFVGAVGRATKKVVERILHKNPLDFLTCYRPKYHDLVIFWDGVAYPCCSTFNRATPGISLGNAYQDSLETLYQRAEGGSVLRVIKSDGFHALYDVVKKFDPRLLTELPPLDKAISGCSICSQIFRNKEVTQRIKAAFTEYEKEQIGEILAHIESAYGVNVAKSIIQSIDSNGV